MTEPAKLEDLLPYLMNRLLAQLNQNLASDLRKLGYTFQDWRILAVLAAHDGASFSQLAEATVIPQPSVSRLVSRLARRGLVVRRTAKKDGRVAGLFITAEGRGAYRKMLRLAETEYRAAMAGFSDAQSKQLRAFVLKMLANRDVTLLA
jgi:DNA-binding MarR family transcriptional regulator